MPSFDPALRQATIDVSAFAGQDATVRVRYEPSGVEDTVTVSVAAAAPATPVLDTALEWWDFQGGSGPAVIGQRGVSDVTLFGAGRDPAGATFDGVDDYGTTTVVPFTGPGSGTIYAAFIANGGGGDKTIFGWGGSGTSAKVVLKVKQGYVRLEWGNGADDLPSVTVASDVLVRVALRVGQSGADGTWTVQNLVTGTSASGTKVNLSASSSTPLVFGRAPVNQNGYLSGTVALAAAFSRSLTAQELSDLDAEAVVRLG